MKGTAATQSRRRYRSEGGLPPPCTAAIAAISAATSRSRGVQVGAKDGPIVLLVTRLDASNRRWESAPAVATALEAAGARVLYYSLDGTISGGVAPLLDGLALFAAADVVIAAHGAALVNSLVLRPGATLLEIVPKVMLEACTHVAFDGEPPAAAHRATRDTASCTFGSRA